MVQNDEIERERRDMAAALDCFTEQQVQVLGGYADTTLINLRKRGQGPDYVVFGKAFLYPRSKLREYLDERIRDRKATGAASPRSML